MVNLWHSGGDKISIVDAKHARQVWPENLLHLLCRHLQYNIWNNLLGERSAEKAEGKPCPLVVE